MPKLLTEYPRKISTRFPKEVEEKMRQLFPGKNMSEIVRLLVMKGLGL
jgi:hypothetical protein